VDIPAFLSLDLATAAILPEEHGSKAANIARLARLAPNLGFSVPRGFVLPQAALDSLWRALGVEPTAAHDLYAAIIERCDVDLARAWQQRIHLVDLPEAITAPLHEAYDELVNRTGCHAVVVRSSFHAEDRAALSCAGIFESVRNVAGSGMLFRALRTVYGSLFAERTVRYLHAAARPVEPRMSVIVQQMLSGAGWSGGVAHSRAPDLHVPQLMLIAATPDLDGVTSGVSCPEEYLVHRPNLLSGRSALVHTTAGTATARRGLSFDEQTVRPLARVLIDLEHAFAEPLEVEWGRDLDGRLYVLQARPVPASEQMAVPLVHPAATPPLLTGLAVGHGSFTGTVRRADTVEEAAHCGPDHVLVTRLTNPDWESALGRVGALVTESGGRTSHAARLARERRLLALVACGDAVAQLRSGDQVTLVCTDGLQGAIYPAHAVEPLRASPTSSQGPALRITNPFAAFTLARAHAPQRVEVSLDQVLHSIRVPADTLSAQRPLSAQIASRIAGYSDVASFVKSKLRDSLAVVCVAFPNAAVRAEPLANSVGGGPHPFQGLLDAAALELAQRFGFQVASLPSTYTISACAFPHTMS
jgi:pyruvate,water dikinase